MQAKGIRWGQQSHLAPAGTSAQESLKLKMPGESTISVLPPAPVAKPSSVEPPAVVQSKTAEISVEQIPPAPIGTPKSSVSDVRQSDHDSSAVDDPRRQEATASIAEEQAKDPEELSEPVSGEAESYQRIPLEQIIGHYGIAGVHPAAELVPMSSDEEFQAACRDVKAYGFLHPVKITGENLLIDGRNRLQIGWALELDPPMERYNPSDPIAYVLSENVVRRHLTVGQRAMIAEKLATLSRGRPGDKSEVPQNFQGGRSQAQVAGKLYITPKAITMARTIRQWGTPEEVQAVEAGTETLEQAYKRAQKKREKTAGPKKPAKRKSQPRGQDDSPESEAYPEDSPDVARQPVEVESNANQSEAGGSEEKQRPYHLLLAFLLDLKAHPQHYDIKIVISDPALTAAYGQVRATFLELVDRLEPKA
jgi:hypothetical protein